MNERHRTRKFNACDYNEASINGEGQPVRSCVVTVCCALLTASAAQGHHSFAPHFDASRSLSISGVITEFEARNPHAYLHIAVADEAGETHEYVCESHGVTQLQRNGIDGELLTPGTPVTIEGSPHRRDPYGCFFQSISIDGGPLLSVNGPRRTPLEASRSASTRTPFNGIFGKWLLKPANRSTSGPDPMMNFLTDAGRAAVAAYDPLVDDPTFECDPVAVRRVWFAPGTPLEIARGENSVILRHEWMDVERVVRLDIDEHPADGPKTSLGHSIGRFDEQGRLIIDTAYYTDGVLRQYVEQADGSLAGMLHSASLHTVETLSFDPATEVLSLKIEFEDPVYYSRPFSPVSGEYAHTNLEIERFGCIAELHD